MSQPSRPRTRGPAQRRRRIHHLERHAPGGAETAHARGRDGPRPRRRSRRHAAPTNANLGTVTIAPRGHDGDRRRVPDPRRRSRQSTELTPISSFGGDIVRIQAGPGGAFGNDVYAISRGAGENARRAVNRPGVIYRVDPATGKTSVFFDLNTRRQPGNARRHHAPPTRSVPRADWSTGMTLRSIPRAISAASPRCTSPASIGRTRT